jgi:hypothetical protein
VSTVPPIAASRAVPSRSALDDLREALLARVRSAAAEDQDAAVRAVTATRQGPGEAAL